MLDLGLLVALLVSLVRAVRAKHGVVIALATLTYLTVMDAWNSLSAPREIGSVMQPFVVMFLGPSALAQRAKGALPTMAVMVAHPLFLRAAAIGIACGVIYVVRRESILLRPESARARALDGIAFPLAFVATAQTAVILLLGLVTALIHSSPL